MHLGPVDPVGGADVEVTEARAESVTFRPRMPIPVQTVAMARPVVPVSVVGSFRKEISAHGVGLASRHCIATVNSNSVSNDSGVHRGGTACALDGSSR